MSVIYLRDYQPTPDDLQEMDLVLLANLAATLRSDIEDCPELFARHKNILTHILRDLTIALECL